MLNRGKRQLTWHPSSGKQECKGFSHQASRQEHLWVSNLQVLGDSTERDSSVTEAEHAKPLLSDGVRPERAQATGQRPG